MYVPPDLSLASSYVPACFCIFKSMTCFFIFLFSPVRGWIALASLLFTDRILWNQNITSSIIDVNAVCTALVGGLIVMHARESGVKSFVQHGVIAVWVSLSALQVLGTLKLPGAVEVITAACCVSVLSCLFQPREFSEIMALRSVVFVGANVVLPYLGVMLQNSEVNTYVIVCRTMPILLGCPEIAGSWVAVYMLCMGYQVRNSKVKQFRCGYTHGSPEPQTSNASNQQQSVCNSTAVCHPPNAVSSEEANLLREALARKQCREC
jgi:hypothetical protein